MRRRGFSVCAMAALFATTAGAQTPTARTVAVAEVRRLESALADDSMEGRLTGSPGGARAASMNREIVSV